jgi:hypothetical protein
MSVYVIGMNVVSLAAIIYTAIRIHWTIGHTAGIVHNKKAIKIHQQVTRILIVQVKFLIRVLKRSFMGKIPFLYIFKFKILFIFSTKNV